MTFLEMNSFFFNLKNDSIACLPVVVVVVVGSGNLKLYYSNPVN